MTDATKRLVLLYHGTQETCGAWFEIAHRALLTQAAAAAGHILFELERAKLDQIDPDMPGGTLAATGGPEPLPVMLRATFDRLMAMVEAGQVGKVAGVAGKAAAPGVPVPWSDVRVGWIVLASDDKDDGWWEAVVTSVENDGRTLQLRWRDFPDAERFSRPILRVGLISPSGQR